MAGKVMQQSRYDADRAMQASATDRASIL